MQDPIISGLCSALDGIIDVCILQGRGIYYDDAGNAYEGLWEKGVRAGRGQQAYLSESADSNDIYEGDWEQDNRFAWHTNDTHMYI